MSTAERVQAVVTAELLRGELAPGSWLRQDELADRLQVSKIPVREALQRLAAIGLVRFEPNRGVTVPALSAAEAEEHFELRRAIEPRLLARAIPRMSIVDLAAAEMALEAGDEHVTEANWRFHRALYSASGWERGLAIAAVLNTAVAPYVLLYTRDLGGAAQSDEEHRVILDACRSGDVGRALALLGRHLDDAEAALHGYFAHPEATT